MMDLQSFSPKSRKFGANNDCWVSPHEHTRAHGAPRNAQYTGTSRPRGVPVSKSGLHAVELLRGTPPQDTSDYATYWGVESNLGVQSVHVQSGNLYSHVSCERNLPCIPMLSTLDVYRFNAATTTRNCQSLDYCEIFTRYC